MHEQLRRDAGALTFDVEQQCLLHDNAKRLIRLVRACSNGALLCESLLTMQRWTYMWLEESHRRTQVHRSLDRAPDRVCAAERAEDCHTGVCALPPLPSLAALALTCPPARALLLASVLQDPARSRRSHPRSATINRSGMPSLRLTDSLSCADAGSILGVPRRCLNIVGATKGCFAGRVSVQVSYRAPLATL